MSSNSNGNSLAKTAIDVDGNMATGMRPNSENGKKSVPESRDWERSPRRVRGLNKIFISMIVAMVYLAGLLLALAAAPQEQHGWIILFSLGLFFAGGIVLILSEVRRRDGE